jgi:hypothetical protein
MVSTSYETGIVQCLPSARASPPIIRARSFPIVHALPSPMCAPSLPCMPLFYHARPLLSVGALPLPVRALSWLVAAFVHPRPRPLLLSLCLAGY